MEYCAYHIINECPMAVAISKSFSVVDNKTTYWIAVSKMPYIINKTNLLAFYECAVYPEFIFTPNGWEYVEA